jgi:hypothetical protein
VVEGFAMEERVIDLARPEGASTLPVAWGWAIVLLVMIALGGVWEARRAGAST